MREIILSSSVLILAILAIRALLKGKIPARLQYALWLLVVVRLVMPGTIGNSPISMQHLVQLSTDAAGGRSLRIYPLPVKIRTASVRLR